MSNSEKSVTAFILHILNIHNSTEISGSEGSPAYSQGIIFLSPCRQLNWNLLFYWLFTSFTLCSIHLNSYFDSTKFAVSSSMQTIRNTFTATIKCLQMSLKQFFFSFPFSIKHFLQLIQHPSGNSYVRFIHSIRTMCQ